MSKIYILTAIPEHIVIEETKELNVDGYILKPFNLFDLDPIINDLISTT